MQTGFIRADHATSRAWSWYWLLGFGSLVGLGVLLICLLNRYPLDRPLRYDDPLQQFIYGSVGSDLTNGLPLEIIKVLPRLFPEYLPSPDSPRDYSAFGFIQQADHDMPMGFSERTRVLTMTGTNCAVCHIGVIATPGHPDGQVIPGMPANTMDLQGFYAFLFAAASDARFSAANILAAIAEQREPDPLEKLSYPLVVPILQGQLLTRKARLKRYFGDASEVPRWGPGRVDTFDTFKLDQFAALYGDQPPADDELYGTVDLPPLWNQRVRKEQGMHLHWDGNNASIRERNFSAAIATGTREDVERVKGDLIKLEDWLLDNLSPPAFPWPIDDALAERGAAIYQRYCFDCHDLKGSRVGQVEDIADIGTDRNRLDSYTERFATIQREYTEGYDWAFKHFKKTNGYANSPLDGLWTRAPFLHNGSVPTLWDLLLPAEQRPQGFYSGDIVYRPDQLGFRSDSPTAPDGRPLMWLDTRQRGNGNHGHSGAAYGTELPDADKLALIEYLKGL